MALLSLAPIVLVTHLPPVPLAVAIAVTTLFMVLVSGRFVPAMAMITASVEPRLRGQLHERERLGAAARLFDRDPGGRARHRAHGQRHADPLRQRRPVRGGRNADRGADRTHAPQCEAPCRSKRRARS